MQTQAQVPGQAPNQATRVQQNGSSVLSQSGNVVGSFKKAWHTEQDVSLRRGVCEQILHLFKKRKPHVTSEWQQKLPDFVKRLEEALYLNAGSKEEYSDTNTLERRLQAVAQTLPAKNQHVSNMANIVPNPGSASTMMPTPGATMMPTPGGGTGMMSGGNGLNSLQAPGNGHVMSAAGSGGSKVAISGSGGLMMPTPGMGAMMQTSGNGTVMQAGNTVIQSPGGIGGLVQGGNMGAPGHSNSISTGAMSKMMQATGHGSSMFSNAVSNILPNSGHPNSLAGQQVYSGMRIAPTQVAPGMSMPQTGSQMIPTPGLTGSQSMAPSVGGLSMANSGPQQHYTAPSSQTYRTLNGQLPTSLNGSLQRKNSSLGVPGINSGVPMMPNGQHLNLGANVHNASGYVNAGQFSNMSSQQQPLRVPPQRQPQHRLPGNGYSMNHSDMNGSGSLYPVTSSSGLVGGNMNLSAMVSQPSKMIPVPGLPQQQGILQQQLQQPQPQPQQLHMQGTSMQQNIGGMNRGQLSLQMSKGQGMFPQQVTTVSGQKQGGLMDQSQQSMTFQQASSDQHQPPRGQMSLSQSQQLQPLQHQGMQQNMGSHLQMRQMQQPRLQQPLQAQKQHQQQQLPQVQAQHPPISSQQQQSVPVQQTQGQSQMQQQSQQAQPLPQLPTEQQQSQQIQVSQSLIAHQALAQRPLQQGQRSFTQGHQVLQRQQMLQEGGQQQQSHVHLQQPVSSPSSLMVGPGDENLNDDGSGSGNGNGSGSGSGSGNGPGNGNGDGNGSGSGNGNGNISTNTNGPGTGPGPGNGNVQPVPGPDVADQRAQQYIKQRRWLLFLRHASKCQAPEGRCPTTPHCHVARQLWAHLSTCRLERDCTYTRCTATRTLVRHYQQCREPRCPVCAPVRQILQAQTRPQSSGQVQLGQNQVPLSSPQTPGQVTVGSPTMGVMPSATTPVSSLPAVSPQIGTAVQGVDIDGPPPAKRVKVESPGIQHQLGPSSKQVLTPSSLLNPMLRSQGVKLDGNPTVKTEVGSHPLRADSHVGNPLRQKQPSSLGPKPDSESTPGTQLVNVKAEPGSVFVKQQQGTPPAPATQVAPANSIKSGKPKIVGTSLTELFTPEQIREHIAGLRQWVGQSKAKAEKNQAMEQKMTENSCHLCAVEKLTFEPPPIYCTACGVRIKRNSSYYTLSAGETKHYCCTACHNECRTENVELDGISYPKIKLERRKNDEETEEAWVQCDSCNLWQHQVCALFNGRRNEGGEAEYICPQCLSSQMENGDRKPLPPSAVLGAKDMPKTFLSDHLESRLARKLDEERQERARLAGKAKEEVPGAEALVVRVVSCVDKKLEVKQRFLEMFQDEDYPSEFPYKSKVILLFQKIEGVEVCLFGMYVQEFGAECAHPNQRRVYLSYLDSVKYFRPDVKTVTGEALRTFVYHEILIGYLEHCKRRGFSSCYIWACPPLKGEDYILYCHPEIQKTPKSDKLREWYLTMLKKAAHESIVVEVTNLYDYFFISQGETKAKVTAARLPYFDGDYWPGAAEDMIVQLQQEEEDGRRLQKKGKPKKMTTTKRNAKVAGQAELPSNASDDTRLMHKLGDSIFPMKEDFIMVHMHFACSHCRMFIVTGKLWSCASCKFWLCNRCYENEQKVDERERHPTTSKEKHVFDVSFVTDVPTDTRDKDEIMESEFFDTRQAFLSLCQGNHYQYDTLRRAKHSSMMVLYHLHNPTAPAFVATCNSCNRDIDTGQGWRCETCVDFDLCHACKDTATHEHKLVMHSERNAQNKEARQMRVLQLRKMLDLLVHASQCGQHNQCNYPKCHSVKMLFRHGMYCAVRASGGCALCKRMWYLLQLHARACKEPVCRVPRCKDLKEHLRRLTQQAESRRRAAVNEMMRQRAAEAAGSTG